MNSFSGLSKGGTSPQIVRFALHPVSLLNPENSVGLQVIGFHVDLPPRAPNPRVPLIMLSRAKYSSEILK